MLCCPKYHVFSHLQSHDLPSHSFTVPLEGTLYYCVCSLDTSDPGAACNFWGGRRGNPNTAPVLRRPAAAGLSLGHGVCCMAVYSENKPSPGERWGRPSASEGLAVEQKRYVKIPLPRHASRPHTSNHKNVGGGREGKSIFAFPLL